MASTNFAGIYFIPDWFEFVSYGACMVRQVDKCIWIIDFGVTDHITSNKDSLFNIQPLGHLLPNYSSKLLQGKSDLHELNSLSFLHIALYHLYTLFSQ